MKVFVQFSALLAAILIAPGGASASKAPASQPFVKYTSRTYAKPAASRTAALAKAYLQRLRVDSELAPIKSRSDLKHYLKAIPKGQSPLDVLAPAAREKFLRNLHFGSMGLGSFSISELEGLTATNIYRILSLFGVQSDTPMIPTARLVTSTDAAIMNMSVSPNAGCPFYGYRCAGVGSCKKAPLYICTCKC